MIRNYNGKKKITKQDIAKEILELAEKIMETRRANKPEDITSEVKFLEELSINHPDFKVIIFKEIDPYIPRPRSSHDYSCGFKFWHHKGRVKTIYIGYDEDAVDIIIRNIWSGIIKARIKKELLTIHKGLAQIAKIEGIEFESKISY